MMSQAAQTHLAGRVFETPVLEQLSENDHISYSEVF
jgi:hypothetical protein